MANEGVSFALRIASAGMVGYLYGTVPVYFIDPLLASHVRFPSRVYPHRTLPLVGVIAVVLWVTSFLAVRRATKKVGERWCLFVACAIPPICAALVTFPLYLPEFPHGAIWGQCIMVVVVSVVSAWIHSHVRDSRPTTKMGISVIRGTVESAKEEATFWRQVMFGFLASYLAILISWMQFVAAMNGQMVRQPEEIFLVNCYGFFGVGLVSIYLMVLPMWEAYDKWRQAVATLQEAESPKACPEEPMQ